MSEQKLAARRPDVHVGNPILTEALRLAGLGLPVVAMHEVTREGCSCIDGAECEHPGNHPRTTHGVNDATTDPAKIREWFTKWPRANLAIATGKNIAGIDIDRHGEIDGIERWASLCSKADYVPTECPIVATGGDGLHLYFNLNGGAQPRSQNLGGGVEIKAAGALLTVPPSIHRSGKRYEWVKPLGSEPLPEFPHFLIEPAPVRASAPSTTVPQGERNVALASLGGSLWKKRITHAALEAALLAENAARCVPPLPESEVRAIARSIAKYEQSAPRAQNLSRENTWPEVMVPEAFIGVAGDFVRLVEPHTEADPCALLANFLIGSGVLFGREAWALADGRKHYPVEDGLLAGATGSGRKGTASTRALEVFNLVDPFFSSHVLSGLSSGEGLIKGVSPKDGDTSTEVRRYLALLPEFASLLAVMKREGNTMSAVLREAWDGTRLRVLTRKEPLDVDNVNLSVIAHVTPEELLNNLTATDRANGFANRFLILLVRRSKFLPEGGAEVDLEVIASRLRDVVKAAEGRGLVQRDVAARALWAREYRRLTNGREGLQGALCGRAEAHVLRLSLLYALLDSAAAIRSEHLQAAIAFWDYCERSIENIFGTTSGDPEAEKILGALASSPMTVTDLHRVFSNNRDTDWILAKMTHLVRSGRVAVVTKDGTTKKGIQAWELRT